MFYLWILCIQDSVDIKTVNKLTPRCNRVIIQIWKIKQKIDFIYLPTLKGYIRYSMWEFLIELKLKKKLFLMELTWKYLNFMFLQWYLKNFVDRQNEKKNKRKREVSFLCRFSFDSITLGEMWLFLNGIIIDEHFFFQCRKGLRIVCGKEKNAVESWIANIYRISSSFMLH